MRNVQLNYFFHDQLVPIFSDVCFDDKFALDGYQRKYPCKFENCKFSNIVFIKGGEFSSLTFSGCQFELDFTVENAAITEIIFENCIFKSKLTLCELSVKTVDFRDCTTADISIEGSSFGREKSQAQITFYSGLFGKTNISCKELISSLNLLGGTFDMFYLSNTTFISEVTFDGANLHLEMVLFQSCLFHRRVVFSNAQGDDTLSFHKVTFNEQVILRHTYQFRSLSLSSVVAKYQFGVDFNGNFTNISLRDCEFSSSFECGFRGEDTKSTDEKYLSCDIDGVTKGNLIFEDIAVSNISLGGSNFGNIIFRDAEVSTIIMKGFVNSGKLTFANPRLVYLHHHLIIFDSNLDKTEFVNVDFRKFKEIVIARSDVSNILLSNSFLPQRIKTGTTDPKWGYEINEEEKINEYTYHRENYRQLKLAMERQGNRRAALIYKALEMNYLRKEIPWGWDKILLHLNYWSNKHGSSWIRGVLFTLLTVVISFLGYRYTITIQMNEPTLYNYLKSPRAVDDLFTFSSSFPGFREQSAAVGWKTHAVLILARIFIGYGIYQTIVAFRKYGAVR